MAFALECDIKLNGNKVGSIITKINISYEKFFEQKSTGVMTESGLKNNDPLIVEFKSYQKDTIK